MVLDSNIVIYSALPENGFLRSIVRAEAASVSAVSFVEVLGYHNLDPDDQTYLEGFFAETIRLPITDAVIDRAVDLRRRRRMDLGDAMIAATALIHNRTLVTRNTADFAWIPELKLVDPFAANPST